MTLVHASNYRELLIGSGRARDKRLKVPSRPENDWACLTTLDCNPDVKPDILWDLNLVPPWKIPTKPGSLGVSFGYEAITECSFDEIHAYEVLEHLGRQGDAHSFFAHFSEIWRLLKPNGYLCATVPSRHSPWAWGDPSHTRLITLESLTFLDQSQYIRQCDGKLSPMSDFRNIYKADFALCCQEDDKETFAFVLQAIKPSRIGTALKAEEIMGRYRNALGELARDATPEKIDFEVKPK
jgi:SAM-dependent methyltransferase